MKKIRQVQNPKKRFSKQTVWAVIIILLMTLSVVGFMWMGPGASSEEYKDYEFTPNIDPTTGMIISWTAEVNDIATEFYYFPEELIYLN